MEKIIFVTGNAAKVERVSHQLKLPLDHQKVDLVEIQSLNLEEVVERKAKEAFRVLIKPVLVDDASLEFTALGRLPGPFIKWFEGELGLEGICRLLDSYDDRSATNRISFGFYDGKILKICSGTVYGHIAKSPRGNLGFGWDPIFIPEGQSKTRAEMDLGEQLKTSARTVALTKMESFLRSHLAL